MCSLHEAFRAERLTEPLRRAGGCRDPSQPRRAAQRPFRAQHVGRPEAASRASSTHLGPCFLLVRNYVLCCAQARAQHTPPYGEGGVCARGLTGHVHDCARVCICRSARCTSVHGWTRSLCTILCTSVHDLGFFLSLAKYAGHTACRAVHKCAHAGQSVLKWITKDHGFITLRHDRANVIALCRH
jgi:hypothetical protein